MGKVLNMNLYFNCKDDIIEGEIWKDILGYEGLYKISDLGRIKSVPRKGTKGGILTQHERMDKNHSKKYLRVALSKDNKTKWFSVNRLVAQAFLENYREDLQVDHINNNEKDNRVCNLQMLTTQDNIIKDQGHKIICVETGQIFNCKGDANEWLGKSRKSGELSRACDYENRTAGGYHWRKIKEGSC